MVSNRNDDEQRSFIDTLLMPFRAIQDWIRDAVSGDDGIRHSERNSIVKTLMTPLRLVGGFLVFMVQAWTTSRNGIAFLRGLPAFSILALTPFLLWGLNNYSRQLSLGPTLGYHQMHLKNQSFDNALLFSRKLVELKPESKQFKYMMAEDVYRNEDTDEATRIMEYLAGDTNIIPVSKVEKNGDENTDETGETPVELEEPEKFGKAHVWLSRELIRKQRVEGFDEERNTLAMDHLKAAIAADPENIRAKVSLVDLYTTRALSKEEGSEARLENLRLARESIEELTGYQNFWRMEQVLAMPQLVNVCIQLDDEPSARRALTSASTKVMRIARLNPEIYEIWYSLVQCAVAVKDYDRAGEFIKTGYQNVKTQETRRKIMQLASLVHIQEADDYKDISDEDNFRNRLFALCKAITRNPRDVKIYDRLVDYIDIDIDEAKRDVSLRNSILDCPLPGVVHILIGTRELLRGDVVAGKTSWDIAQHQFGSTEFVTHRLLSVAIRKDPKFGEGDLLNTALLLFPDQHMLYETRGTILKGKAIALMDEQREQEARQVYDDAIKDFENVLEKIPDLITAHKQLKDCYEAIGQPEKSTFHGNKVQELLEAIDEKQRELYEKVLKTL